MTIPTLRQRKACSFCGAPLNIPAEAAQALAAQPAATGGRVTASCPVCARNASIERTPANRHVCSYCTCAYSLDAANKPVPIAVVLPFPEPVHDAVNTVPCASCKLKKLRAKETAAAEAVCEACGAVQDLYTLPLDRLVQLPASGGTSPLAETVCTALLARWERHEVGLAEAWWILEKLAGVDEALSAQRSIVSALSPALAAEAVKFGVFESPSAEVQSDGFGGVTLFVLRRASNSGFSLDDTLNSNQGAFAMLALTGRMRIKEAPDQGMKADPALILHFYQSQNGTAVRVQQRNTEGVVRDVSAAKQTEIEARIQNVLPDILRRLFAFKAIYGHWITGAMLYGTPAAALKARLQILGGSLAMQAEVLSKALTLSSAQ